VLKQIGFRNKLIFGFSGISFLGLVVCGTVSYFFASGILTELTWRDLSNQLIGVESLINVTYQDNIERHRTLMGKWQPKVARQLRVDPRHSQSHTVEDQVSHEKYQVLVPLLLRNGRAIQTNEWVDEIYDQSGDATTFFVRIPQGFVRVSTSIRKADGTRATGTFIPNASPVAKTLIEGKPYLGRAEVVGVWHTTAYVPLFLDGKVVGSFFLGSPETSTLKIREYLRSRKILKTGYFYILNSEGKFILHPSKEGENVLHTNDADGKPIFENIISQKTGILRYRWLNTETHQVQSKLAIFRYFPEMDWYVSASLNVEEAEEALSSLKWILVCISLSVTLVLIVISYFFGGSVVRRLHALNLELSEAASQIENTAISLKTISTHLAQATIDQAASLEETVSALEEIRAMVGKNQESVKLTEDLSSKTEEAAKQGQAVTSGLHEAISNISTSNSQVKIETEASHQKIRQITTVIAAIEEKTKVIHQIVFQTKLLSFNASVEAARAGEHGKGFAVVAEEMGNLAAMSGAAARDIQTSLETSVGQVREIIGESQIRISAMIEQSGEKVSQGVKISTLCFDSLEGILNQVGETHQAVREIALASYEQVKGVDEISKAMSQIDQITQKNSTAAMQAKNASDDLKRNSDELIATVRNLKSFIEGASENQ
jgi:methyl-accepting chemotaxis protein